MEILACRGGHVETRHLVAAMAVSHTGNILWQTLNAPTCATYLRSAAKLWQAAAGWTLSDLEALPDQALAVAAASHTGSPEHQHWVQFWLNQAGLEASALACGAHAPLDKQENHRLIRENVRPSAIHNNCSGKHAAMLASCIAHSWPIQDYLSHVHPLQQAIFKSLSPEYDLQSAIDGCGLPTFWMSLAQIATLYAHALECPVRRRILHACLNYPVLAGGENRIDTLLMQASGGKLYAKVGADGLIGITRIDDAAAGLALKVLDGHESARSVAVLSVLESLGWLSPETAQRIRETLKLDKRVNWTGHAIGHWEICQ